ncbi:hypothetical protein AABD61_13185 [Edwardsiella piscicida]|uniref:hypothetical protein n=1 Tax=Edwardsiella piscicida TaxID=1263550 RepID=UPI00370D2630
MEQQEPQVIAGNMSNDDLLKWMEEKVSAANSLACALYKKRELLQKLECIEVRITELTKNAAVDIFVLRADVTGLEEPHNEGGTFKIKPNNIILNDVTINEAMEKMNGPQLAAADFFKSKIKPTILSSSSCQETQK